MRLMGSLLVAGALLLSACGVAPTQVARSSANATGAARALSSTPLPDDVIEAVRNKLKADYGFSGSVHVTRSTQAGHFTFFGNESLKNRPGANVFREIDGTFENGVVTVTSDRTQTYRPNPGNWGANS